MSSQMDPHYRPKDEEMKDWIKRSEDGETITLNPRALDITWGGDSRYWEKPIDKEQPITLSQVSWLEVTGKIKQEHLNLQPNTVYRLSFKLSLKQDAFGWNNCPVYLMVRSQDKNVWKKEDLGSLSKDESKPELIPRNGSLLIKIGNTVPETHSFGLYEIWRGRWKGGLRIHSVVIQRVENL